MRQVTDRKRMIKQKSLMFAANSTIENVKIRHLSRNTEMVF